MLVAPDKHPSQRPVDLIPIEMGAQLKGINENESSDNPRYANYFIDEMQQRKQWKTNRTAKHTPHQNQKLLVEQVMDKRKLSRYST